MSLFSTLKRNARHALSGNWGKAILVLLIGAGISMLLSAIQGACLNLFVLPMLEGGSAIESATEFWWFAVQEAGGELAILVLFSLLGMLLSAPVLLGTLHWFYALAGGHRPTVSEIFRFFDSFSNYRRAVWFYVQATLRSLLWAIPFYALPCVLGATAMAFLSVSDGEKALAYTATIALLVASVLSILSSVLYVIFIQRYALVPFLLCDETEENMRVGDAFRLSVRFTKGYRGSLFLFSLSFIGWWLLTAMTFGLLALYVSPYYSAAQSLYARYIIHKNRCQTTNATREFQI